MRFPRSGGEFSDDKTCFLCHPLFPPFQQPVTIALWGQVSLELHLVAPNMFLVYCQFLVFVQDYS